MKTISFVTSHVIKRADGGVSYTALRPGVEPKEALAQWTEGKPAAWLPATIEPLPTGWLMPDRTFRDAVGHDHKVRMPLAREIHKERLRKLREPIMARLDVEYMRADEAGDTAAKLVIAAKKKLLRDVTADPAVASASTPEQLNKAVPVILKEVS